MKKKITVLTLCAMLFALSYSASAQQPKKVPLLGYLLTGNADTVSARSAVRRWSIVTDELIGQLRLLP
jgi:hypothetical protein